MARSEREHGVGGWIRYGLPGLVVGLALAWGLEGRGPKALAQPPQGAAGLAMPGMGVDRARPATAATEAASGTIAMSVPGSGSGQFLYLIDTRTKSLAVYNFEAPTGASKGGLKLLAARQYQWDLQLTEYNCLPPEVAAIESTVRSLGRQTTR